MSRGLALTFYKLFNKKFTSLARLKTLQPETLGTRAMRDKSAPGGAVMCY